MADGEYDAQFPIDIFQTGSGTSTNMNANEVIATLATQMLGRKVHPNDHVNMSQSSNDVIPTAINVAAYLEAKDTLIPGLQHLRTTIVGRMGELGDVVKTGRTHLMDAMPDYAGSGDERLGDAAPQGHRAPSELLWCGWDSLPRAARPWAPGINADPCFGPPVASILAGWTGCAFSANENYFEALAASDAVVELSGQLKTVAAQPLGAHERVGVGNDRRLHAQIVARRQRMVNPIHPPLGARLGVVVVVQPETRVQQHDGAIFGQTADERADQLRFSGVSGKGRPEIEADGGVVRGQTVAVRGERRLDERLESCVSEQQADRGLRSTRRNAAGDTSDTDGASRRS